MNWLSHNEMIWAKQTKLIYQMEKLHYETIALMMKWDRDIPKYFEGIIKKA